MCLRKPRGYRATVCLALVGLGVFFGAWYVWATATRVVDRAEIWIDQSIGKRVYQGKPFTGEAQIRSADGRLVSSEFFKDGLRHGAYKKYFANGQLSYEAEFRHGLRYGVSRSWWDNGNIRAETHYHNNQLHGLAWQWYRSGERFKRHHYVDGKPQGLQQAWRKNGKLYANYEYRHGRVYGLNKADLCVELDNEKLVLTND